jgi:hypothetical protein
MNISIQMYRFYNIYISKLLSILNLIIIIYIHILLRNINYSNSVIFASILQPLKPLFYLTS